MEMHTAKCFDLLSGYYVATIGDIRGPEEPTRRL